jgi:transglutaminase-like putative cysteine protease
MRPVWLLAAPLLALAVWGGPPALATVTNPEPVGEPAAGTATTRRTAFSYLLSYSNIPKLLTKIDVWVPLPFKDDNQSVSDLVIQAPGGGTMGTESVHGNQIHHSSSGRRGGVAFNVTVQFVVERHEIRFDDLTKGPAIPPPAPPDLEQYLKGSRLAPIDAEVKALATRLAAGRKTAAEKARAIYDHVVDNMKLNRDGKGWGLGDLRYALALRKGDSLDLSAAFVGLAQAAGIPARTVVGFKLPDDRKEGFLTRYHAWAEFYLNQLGWIPVDPAEAISQPAKRDEWFGKLDANRIQMSVGRDITLTPPQESEPLNFLFYPYAEGEGKTLGGSAYRFTFREAPAPPEASTASSR